MEIFNVLRQQWPWYIAGPIIGLSVPLLLLAGNKMLGISSTLRQICAMCFPANIPFLKYKWKDQLWKIFFAVGLLLGGFIGGVLLKPITMPQISDATIKDMRLMGISYRENILPAEIYSWAHLLTWQNLLIVVGGLFSWLRNPLCRRLYQRTWNFRTINIAMAISCCSSIIFCQRHTYSQFYFTLIT